MKPSGPLPPSAAERIPLEVCEGLRRQEAGRRLVEALEMRLEKRMSTLFAVSSSEAELARGRAAELTELLQQLKREGR